MAITEKIVVAVKMNVPSLSKISLPPVISGLCLLSVSYGGKKAYLLKFCLLE